MSSTTVIAPRIAVLGPHRKQFQQLLPKLDAHFEDRYHFVWLDHDKVHPFKGQYAFIFVMTRFIRHHKWERASEHCGHVVSVTTGMSGLHESIISTLP